jgi:glutathione peroxidase
MLSVKQKILRFAYPVLEFFGKHLKMKAGYATNKNNIVPNTAWPLATITLNNGSAISIEAVANKKVLIVNTASNCGYTQQYDGLEKLYQLKKDKLIIIGFPCNDFKEQEQDNDEKIAEFCKINFGVSFPLSKKVSVVNNQQQHQLYNWLSNPEKNGWCNLTPEWNFSKYLIDENGKLLAYFGPGITPEDSKLVDLL